MSGLEIVLPIVFGGVGAAAQVATAIQGSKKQPSQVSSIAYRNHGKPADKTDMQQVQPNQWAAKNYNFAQYNDRAYCHIGADGSISGGSMAGGQCIAFSATTPPQHKKKWYQ